MPLSEEEARLLQQLEQSLAAEDPDFASTLRGSAMEARNRKFAVLAAVGFLAGLGVMFYGTVLTYTWLAVLGFFVMIASGYVFIGAWRRGFGTISDAPTEPSDRGPRGTSRRPGKKNASGGGSFVERMEQRWQKRRDDERGF